MQAFEAAIAKFASVDAQVLGISVDSAPSKKAWAESLGVKSFPLISDFWPHGAVAEKYGILREEGFSERATFIIDKEGVIRYKKIHPIGELPDLEELLDVLKSI
jgi:peroxiredoxin